MVFSSILRFPDSERVIKSPFSLMTVYYLSHGQAIYFRLRSGSVPPVPCSSRGLWSRSSAGQQIKNKNRRAILQNREKARQQIRKKETAKMEIKTQIIYCTI